MPCDNGVKLHLNEEVTGICKDNDHYVVTTSKAKYEAKVVVNAAGTS
jgi:L-2-hydroxyglutarate oxidase LhgO